MACHVDDGALVRCMYGITPMPIHASGHVPIATVNDRAPFVNIPPFCLCTSPTNPIAILLESLGIPDPVVPCLPLVPEPWQVANLHRVWVKGARALDRQSSAFCMWGDGRIEIVNPRKP
jgi:uncharacterized protein DUF4280